MVSTSVPMPFAPKHASLGMPYDQLTEKGKTRPWFTDGSVSYIVITKKQTDTALQFLTGTTLQDTGKRKLSHWAELQAVHMVIHSIWKEIWPGV